MLMRFDPFRELDRITSEVFGREGHRLSTLSGMPMDARKVGDRLMVDFDLPGVDPDSIDVTVDKDELTVKAERSLKHTDDEELIVSERPQGSFTRQLYLGETLDTDAIEASYDQGVLHLEIPVAEAEKPRRVKVGSGGGRQAIETTAGHN